jgi:hypothetical protein
MREKEFDKLGNEYFGAVLEPYGFSAEKSRHCTFYKKVGDLYHVIMPDIDRSGTSFIIRVFTTSPLIDPSFDERFPDDIGIPSDVCSALHPVKGVGFREHNYRCKYEEGFVRNFNKDAKPALLEKALPYLNEITTLQDMLPFIKSPFYTSVTMWLLGEKLEAKPLLEAELQRLTPIKDDSGKISNSVDFIKGLLSPH